MSNRAYLVAEDSPDLVGPGTRRDGRGASGTVVFAGCAWQVPVFWSFCFGLEDLGEFRCADGDGVPALVSPMGRVRRRLAERDALARSTFWQHAAAWRTWRAAVEAVPRGYLKTCLSGIWCLYEDPGSLKRDLTAGLGWLAGRAPDGLARLTALAGIHAYDRKSGTFTLSPCRECAERFLYGWLE